MTECWSEKYILKRLKACENEVLVAEAQIRNFKTIISIRKDLIKKYKKCLVKVKK
jgi:hypothetical protein